MKDKILSAAVRIAKNGGLVALTRSAVAKAANVAPGSVSYHFDGMPGLVSAVVAEAIRTKNWPIIAGAIVAKHIATEVLSPEFKRTALDSLAK